MPFRSLLMLIRTIMSALLEMLSMLRAKVELYHNARVCGDWVIQEHSTGATCFHMATQGTCQLDIPELGQWQLGEGDLVLFPRELPHTMYPEQSCLSQGSQRHLPIHESQAQAGTSMLCGQILFQHRAARQLLDALPSVIIIPSNPDTPWLGHLLALIIEESLQGAQLDNPVLNRSCELLFTYAVRHYVESLHGSGDQHPVNLLSLYAHPQLSVAINAIHQHTGKPWTLASLAKEAAMSRTRFANLFKSVSGMSAGEYLMWWRMQVAWEALEQGNGLSDVAERIGYRSEAAFSRAFKAHFGQTAGHVRRKG